MPPSAVRSARDEAKWQRAKEIVEKQLRKKKGKKPINKWALTMHIYQNMKKAKPLVLDIEKADLSILRAPNAPGAEQRWARFPGAASMFNQREYAETQRLMSTMPTPKLMLSDGNFTSPYDVVKGLGFSPNDETIWAHRVARMVARASSELALRKALHEDLRQETLDPTLRHELNRRVLSFFRQSRGGKPLEKALHDSPSLASNGKSRTQRRASSAPQDVSSDKRVDASAPAVDDADLEGLPSDQALLRQKIHSLHEQLKGAVNAISGNHAMIHMHNDLKAAMRAAYREPDPQRVKDLDHKVHHFLKLVEGPKATQNEMLKSPPGRVAKSGLFLDLAKAADGGFGRAGHKYIRRISKSGGGYEYAYDESTQRRALAPGPTQAPVKPSAPKPISTREIDGVRVHIYPPGQAPTPPAGRVVKRHWIDHHPDHPTFAQGGTAKKYGIDPKTGIPSDPARAKLHEEIIAKHFDHVPSVPAGQKPVAIVTMGGPTSGKVTAIKNLGFAGRNDFVQVDPDAIKTGEAHLGTPGLPEFHEAVSVGHLEDGTPVSAKSGAAIVHEESNYIADRLRNKAVEARKNVIIDGTGKDADKHIALVKDLKARGYYVYLVMPHQTAEKAKELNRHRAADTGRYVPDDVIDMAYSKIPHNFEAVAAHADHATLFDARTFPPKKVYEKHAEGETIHDAEFMADFRAKYGPGKIQKSEIGMPKKINNRRPPAIDPAKISAMIEDAFTKGVQAESARSSFGPVDEGMDDSHAYEDTHIDIGLRRGTIKRSKSDD